MKKSGTITFHAAHNYGSMLQAYALQKVVTGMGVENEIINFRSESQKDAYSNTLRRSTGISLKSGLRMLASLPYRKALKKRSGLFEKFLKDELKCTKEYKTSEELKSLSGAYDVFIAGSDQIWNTACTDFDFAYFLEFVGKGKKISYAPSLGPHPDNESNIGNSGRIAEALKCFECISVRETASADFIELITKMRPEVVTDPTLLLSADEWKEKIPPRRIKEPYILYYSPGYKRDWSEYAINLARQKGIKLVDTIFSPRGIFTGGYKKMYETGPFEFLSLLLNAEMILSGSFHAVVFSLLLHKHVIALDGNKDSRITNLLDRVGLQRLSVKTGTPSENLPAPVSDKEFEVADDAMNKERKNGLNFLKNAFETN